MYIFCYRVSEPLAVSYTNPVNSLSLISATLASVLTKASILSASRVWPKSRAPIAPARVFGPRVLRSSSGDKQR